MPRVDPLRNAIAAYAADKWMDTDWRVFGRETGTSNIIDGHPRLYRSLGFGDDDYPDAASEVVRQILASEAVEENSGEAGRMELFADSMPDLPTWTENSAPARTGGSSRTTWTRAMHQKFPPFGRLNRRRNSKLILMPG